MQKLLCQVATTELLPRGDKENGHTKKMTKARFDWCLIVMVLSLSNLADPYFCTLMVTTAAAQEEGLFKIQTN